MNYSVHLKNFEGPLDLLLALVSSAKIEIKDIFISEITEQYLALMEETKDLDMETASSFLSTASDLLYIKSRSLLPKPESDDDLDEDGLTPEERFTKKLMEYKAYKEVSEKLRDFEKRGLLTRYKLPEEILPPADSSDDMVLSAQLIINAYSKLLKKLAPDAPDVPSVKIERDSYTVEGQMKRITAFLAIMPKLRFEEFLTEMPTREELAVTFFAMLELLHSGKITAVQDGPFGVIYIEKRTDKGE